MRRITNPSPTHSLTRGERCVVAPCLLRNPDLFHFLRYKKFQVTVRMSQVKQNPFQRQLPITIEELFKRNKLKSLNRPFAAPRSRAALPRGKQSFQLYSLATPNGQKVGILLEELGIPYDAHYIIINGPQFSTGFIGANPNSKIPCAIDLEGPDGDPIALMESAAIMQYLCEKYPEKGFLPANRRLRYECMQWLFWQVSTQGPMTGNYGHFMVYAPGDKVEARNYGVERYGMDVMRICDVLERHLAGYRDMKGGHENYGVREYLVGGRYTVADMACYPWAKMLFAESPNAAYNRHGQTPTYKFMDLKNKFPHLLKWVKRIDKRDSVRRGMLVCHGTGKPFENKEHPLYRARI